MNHDHAAIYTGREAVPIPPVYDPVDDVQAIVRLADDPEDEVVVGGAGKVMTAVHAVASAVTEKLPGKETRVAQMGAAPPAPLTPGNVHVPVAEGAGIHGASP